MVQLPTPKIRGTKLHGLLAGSDASEPWMRGVYGMAIGAVGFLTPMRLVGGRRRVVAVAEQT